MSQPAPKKLSAAGFLARTLTLYTGSLIVAFTLTWLYVYQNMSTFFNWAAALFPQPIVISGFTLAYVSVSFVLFIIISMILFAAGKRKL